MQSLKYICHTCTHTRVKPKCFLLGHNKSLKGCFCSHCHVRDVCSNGATVVSHYDTKQSLPSLFHLVDCIITQTCDQRLCLRSCCRSRSVCVRFILMMDDVHAGQPQRVIIMIQRVFDCICSLYVYSLAKYERYISSTIWNKCRHEETST